MSKRTLKNMQWGNKELPNDFESTSLSTLASRENAKLRGIVNVEMKRGIFSDEFDIIENAKKQFRAAAKKKMVLTKEQAESIRTEFDNGASRKELQEKYGVSKSTIQRIVAGTRY